MCNITSHEYEKEEVVQGRQGDGEGWKGETGAAKETRGGGRLAAGHTGDFGRPM